VKDVKRAKEKRSLSWDGRRRAEGLKNEQLAAFFFIPSALPSTVNKRASGFLQLSSCPSRLHVKGFGEWIT
jgi:hypothetical protein